MLLSANPDSYAIGFVGTVGSGLYDSGVNYWYNGSIEFSVTGELADEFVVTGGQGTGRLKWEGSVYRRSTFPNDPFARAVATFTTPFGEFTFGNDFPVGPSGCMVGCYYFVRFEYGIPYQLALTLRATVKGEWPRGNEVIMLNSFRLTEIQDLDGNPVEGARVINASELPEPGTFMTMVAGIVATCLLRRFTRP